jgi:hypothetical protein
MRLLLFLVSCIFSLVFYGFYLLSNWDKIFWENLKIWEISWISGNLLIESIVFLALWIVFIIFFSPLNKDSKNIDKKMVYNILFYIFLLFPLYFGIFWKIDKIIITLIILFVFWDISFRILSNIPDFEWQKTKLRYFWLTLNYLISISALCYLFLLDFSYYLFLICIFSAIFNFQIHKNYWNYISLTISVIIAILLLVCLIFEGRKIWLEIFS